jgi:hypothetical protein
MVSCTCGIAMVLWTNGIEIVSQVEDVLKRLYGCNAGQLSFVLWRANKTIFNITVAVLDCIRL